MPGVIIQSLKKIKTNNPVFLLDEIDKLGRDNRGDPGSAMLEVLDPNQNDKFTDHFLGTPFDLSNVVFIATANSLDTIHPALLDRMEIVDISGYSLQEKLEIAKKYLIPKQIQENGINGDIIKFLDPQIEKIICEYTMESGVRSLDVSSMFINIEI
jgi:ATP-dependent Lon protease